MAPVGIASLAFGLRATHVHQTRSDATVRYLVGDAAGYYQWAQRIAAGDWWGSESFYQAPLYPYVLAVWFKLAGDEVQKVRYVQSVSGAGAAVLLYFAIAAFMDRRVAIVAASLFAAYPPAIFFDGIVQKATLDGVLVCAILALISHGRRRDDTPSQSSKPRATSGTDHATHLNQRDKRVGDRLAWRSAVLGVLLGLLILTRENAILWIPLFAVWICWQSAKSGTYQTRFCHLAAFFLGLSLVLLPVGWRNYCVSGEWSISTFQAGPNFYIGNHRGAPGYYQPLVRGHETPVHERSDAERLAEQLAGRALSDRETSQFWMQRTWGEIGQAPREWLALLGRKLLILVNQYEIADVESLYVARANSVVLGGLRFLGWGTVFPLAMLGMWVGRKNGKELWILHAMMISMSLAIVAFYVMARYRYVLVPLIMAFAAMAIVQLCHWLRTHESRKLAGSVCAVALGGLLVNWPLHDESKLNALARMNVGIALAQVGDIEAASEYFVVAVREHPASAEAHNNLAQALAIRGRYEESVEHYRAALQLAGLWRLEGSESPGEPSPAQRAFIGAWYNLGVALESLGKIEDARFAYARAVEFDPEDTQARACLERLKARN